MHQSAAQLRQLCHDRGINTRRLKKLDLVRALEEFDSDNNDDQNNDVENSVVGDDEVQLSRNLHDQRCRRHLVGIVDLCCSILMRTINLIPCLRANCCVRNLTSRKIQITLA